MDMSFKIYYYNKRPGKSLVYLNEGSAFIDGGGSPYNMFFADNKQHWE